MNVSGSPFKEGRSKVCGERVLREHLSAWATALFAVLLLVLTVSEAPNAAIGSVVLLVAGVAVLALFLVTEHTARRHG